MALPLLERPAGSAGSAGKTGGYCAAKRERVTDTGGVTIAEFARVTGDAAYHVCAFNGWRRGERIEHHPVATVNVYPSTSTCGRAAL
ncbi:hypothetical protein GCM10009558_085120 [Virgisporangium aurantiacum]